MENELRLKITYIKADEGGYVGRVDGISGTISEADSLDELKQNLMKTISPESMYSKIGQQKLAIE